MKVSGGQTNVTTYFALRNTADGLATTAATITDIDLQYVRSGALPVAKVDATALAATDSAHADNKAIEIDATDQPGLYRIDWPDAAFAAGVTEVILSVKLTGSFTEHLAVQIDTPVNMTQIGGNTQSATDLKDFADDGYDPATNKVEGVKTVDTVTTLTGHTVQTGDNFPRLGAPSGASVSADIADVPTVSEFNARTILSASYFDPAADTVANVTTVATTTTNTDMRGTDGVDTATMRGTDSAATATNLAIVDTVVDGIQSDLDNGTDGLGALKTLIDLVNTDLSNGTDGLGALKTLIDTVNTDLSNGTDGLGALKILIDAVQADLDNGTDGLGALKTLIDALNDLSASEVNTEVLDVLNVDQISENAQGIPPVTPTHRQAIMLMYMALRNAIKSNATTLEINNDAGTVITKKTVNDDGTDYTELKMVSGP